MTKNFSKAGSKVRLGTAAGLLAAALGAAACGGGAVPPAAAPSGAGGAAGTPGSADGRGTGRRGGPGAPGADPFALPDGPRDDDPVMPPAPPLRFDAWERAAKAKGIVPPPPSCSTFARSGTAGSGSPVETVRAAESAPVACADVIVDPLLSNAGKRGALAAEVAHALVGHSLAARLSRTARTAPSMAGLADKEKVKAFIAGPLRTWMVEQASAIEALSAGATGLVGYGRGVAALEAGIAEMRLVDEMRSAPVPASWDPELRAVYEASLDEALEPRKRRGRDAALVGMSDFARVGIVRDGRLDRARALLGKLYGGRRIDALDALLVPLPASKAAPGGSAWVVAFDPAAVEKDPFLLASGIPQSTRAAFRAGRAAGTVSPSAYARARFDMGRVYWRRIDFVEAAYAAKASPAPEDRLVLAVALALVHGPNGAAEMMRAPSPAALDTKHTEALDALVEEHGPLSGVAAFDAAHLRALCPPDGADAPAYLRDVAARFRRAEALLADPAQKKAAAERAAEVEAVAAAAEKRSSS